MEAGAKKKRWMENWTWKQGLAFILVCAIVGYLVGVVATKASAQCVPDQPGCSSTVSSPRQGVWKFKHHQLGRAPATMHYSPRSKRIILDKLMAKQSRCASCTGARRTHLLSRTEMWAEYTKQDNCVFKVSIQSNPNTASWSCANSNRPPFDDTGDWSPRDVRAVICGGVAGIGVGVVITGGAATGPAAPFAWAGVGSAWILCMWQKQIENAAN